MPEDAAFLRAFILDYLKEIEAEVQEADGVYTVNFPPGRKRRFGGERMFTFDEEKRRDQVEHITPGSPFVKLLLADAKLWSGIGAWTTREFPERTLVYTFQLEAFSSVRKHTGFAWAALEPGKPDPRVSPGLPPFVNAALEGDEPTKAEVESLQAALPNVVPAVERAGRSFAAAAVRESHEGYGQAMERVKQYVQGMKQDSYLEEAKLRKRLGEIQSKLYFTEDGLRELKLQREQERLTAELHVLKKRGIEAGEATQQEWAKHEETQRRRHEPKLRIRVIGATVTHMPAPVAALEPAPAPETASANGHQSG